MAGRPITDDDRDRVRALHAQGRTRNQIAREIGRSGSTVSKVAADLNLSFERGPEVAAATEARRTDLAARRAALAVALHAEAERLLGQMREPARVFAFGGKQNVYSEEWLPEPPASDKRTLMSAIGIAVDRSIKLAPPQSGTADESRSIVGDLMAGLRRDYETRHSANG